MLDNGATVNIVKLRALSPKLTVNINKSLKIWGITPESMRTIGTVSLTILERPYTFHVVNDRFFFSEDRTIGRNLMKREEAAMSHYYNALVLAGDVMHPIPFVTDEDGDFHLNQRLRQDRCAEHERDQTARVWLSNTSDGHVHCHDGCDGTTSD